MQPIIVGPGLAWTVPVVGSILAAIETWLLGKLTDIVFAKCDGIVGVEMRAMIGLTSSLDQWRP